MSIPKAAPQYKIHPIKKRSRTKKVELVLGGGGVKGFAHVGFLKAIEELNIDFGTITGVSIGCLIAVLYVNGYSTEQIEKIFAEELRFISPTKLAIAMLLPAPVDRLVFGEKSLSLLALMRRLVARYKLQPKNNLRLVAFNALTREPVVYTGKNYDLAMAMAASCSIPFVFRPIENGEEVSLITWLTHRLFGIFSWGRSREQELLFDGGLFHPAPTDFCQGPAIVAKLGFASSGPSEHLNLADYLFHKAEQFASGLLDALFADPQANSKHVLITVASNDVAALSFGISTRQQKSLTRNAYRRSITALKAAVAAGRVPVK